MGFRNPSGEEVAFGVIEEQTEDAQTRLAGPNAGGQVGRTGINQRGYIDVVFPDQNGGVLNKSTVTDLAPEFELVLGNAASTLRLDETQASLYRSGSTFRFWTQGALASGDSVQIRFLRETRSYFAASGEEEFNQNGAFSDANGGLQNATPDAQTPTPVSGPYIDVKLIPSLDTTLDDAQLQTIAAGVAALFRLERQGVAGPSVITTGNAAKAPIVLGNGMIRYFLAGNLDSGEYDVIFEAGAWTDASGAESAAAEASFKVADPTARVIRPFDINDPRIDVAVINDTAPDLSLIHI